MALSIENRIFWKWPIYNLYKLEATATNYIDLPGETLNEIKDFQTFKQNHR